MEFHVFGGLYSLCLTYGGTFQRIQFLTAENLALYLSKVLNIIKRPLHKIL